MGGRVSIYEGDTPILITAPHAPDDEGTGVIAEVLIKNLDCCGVINRGWKSNKTFNYDNEEANCNDISQIHKNVIKDEFLRPMLIYQKRLRSRHPIVYMFTIHGISPKVRREANDPLLDVIIGFGAGNPPAYTCQFWRKNLLIEILRKSSLTVYEGKPRSKYAARHKNNLAQLFNLGCWYPDNGTHSMQIEIIEDLRVGKDSAEITGIFLADAFKALLKHTSWSEPSDFQVQQI